MNGNTTAFEENVSLLKDVFSGKESFTLKDAEEVLKKNSATVRWYISNMQKSGYIKRIKPGVYSFEDYKNEIQPIYLPLTRKLNEILQESGYRYFISGLDILGSYMQHIPESYPIMLFVDRYSINEVQELLNQNYIMAVRATDYKNSDFFKRFRTSDEIVIIYSTSEFEYSKNGFAFKEKAFVDLYYEITKREYPLSLQELVRMYVNLIRKHDLNRQLMINIARRRKIQQDLRYIAEYKYIQKHAFDFVDILKREEGYEL